MSYIPIPTVYIYIYRFEIIYNMLFWYTYRPYHFLTHLLLSINVNFLLFFYLPSDTNGIHRSNVTLSVRYLRLYDEGANMVRTVTFFVLSFTSLSSLRCNTFGSQSQHRMPWPLYTVFLKPLSG